MAVDRWSEVLALAACLVGLVVVVMAWPRRTADRSPPGQPKQPAAAPPAIVVKLDTIGDEPRWRVANRHGILNVSIDIVAFRPADADGPWESEPIEQPIVLSPGRSTTLPSVVTDPALPHDVVVAWSVHHLDGEVSNRRTFRVSPDAEVPVAPAHVDVASGPTHGVARVYAAIAVVLVATGGVAAWRLLASSDVSSGVAALPAVATPSSEAPTTTAVPAPSTTEAAPATTAASPEQSSLSPATSTPTTIASSTTTSTSTSTTLPFSPVMIDGRTGACRFGPNCLIASFRLDGFPREGNYICEFRDGTRVTFRYVGDGAEDACAASGRNPSITIEVDGVRSATITRESPTGA